MSNRVYNPERRVWRGRSYRKGGRRIRDLRYDTKLVDVREEDKRRSKVKLD